MCELWPWRLQYDRELKSRCICLKYHQYRHRFWVCVRCDLDLGDMTFVSRSWHTLGSWTLIVWDIIKIKHGSEELWPGLIFWICFRCDLELSDMALVQGHDTPLGHGQQLCEILSRSDKGVRSYGPYTMWTNELMDRQNDRRILGDSYKPYPKFVCREYNNLSWLFEHV